MKRRLRSSGFEMIVEEPLDQLIDCLKDDPKRLERLFICKVKESEKWGFLVTIDCPKPCTEGC